MPVVLVTGSGRRLGKEIALALGRAGWDVAVHHGMSRWPAYETVDQLLEMGVKAHAFGADLENEAECRALLPAVIETMGDVHAVVNNASAFEEDDAEHFTYTRLMRHMKVNAAPAVILAQALYEHTKGKNESAKDELDFVPAAVVNMLDQKLWGLNPDYLSYTLSKAALNAAGEMLAMELAPWVRVVGVAPGFTLPTPMMTDQRVFDRLHKIAPLGKSSTVESVTDTVLFALKNASLTGTNIVVDGGQHLMRMTKDISKL